jgi:hypothetical protein
MSPTSLVGPLLAVALTTCASVTAPRSDSITEIVLERDCSGCETAVAMTLRRDGAATLEKTGKARFRTSDQSFTARVTRADFDRLAALLVSRGFFEMRDEYRDPSLADGAWITTSAVRDGNAKKVLDSNEAGPPALKAIEEAIEGVRASITWVAVTP